MPSKTLEKTPNWDKINSTHKPSKSAGKKLNRCINGADDIRREIQEHFDNEDLNENLNKQFSSDVKIEKLCKNNFPSEVGNTVKL